MELCDFQNRTIAKLGEAMEGNKRDIILKSPTGSGKTIILTHFSFEYMREHANTLFVWLTPGKGNLEEQSKAKMDRYCHGAQTKLLEDVMTSGFSAGDAVFINWEKLNSKSNVAMRDSERDNFLDKIRIAHECGLVFKVIIDESHCNFNDTSEAIVDLFKTSKIIRASATPIILQNAEYIVVTEEDVIAAHLIKKFISINPDFPSNQQIGNDRDAALYLIEKALEKRLNLKKAFMNIASMVNPLVIIQLPNRSNALLETIENWLGSEKQIDVEGGKLAVWLSDRHDNIDGIEENTGVQEVAIIKQAVAMGWDCPRAHILVKLRENTDENFEIQTVGRIRRMPEAKHYNNELLDSCYIYTFDGRFTAGVKESLGVKALNSRLLFLKNEYRDIELDCEQKTMVTSYRDPEIALSAVIAYMRHKYHLGANCADNKTRLESCGYVFGSNIVTLTISGRIALLNELPNLDNFDTIQINIPLNTHSHGRDFHHSVGVVGGSCSMSYDDAIILIRRIFADAAPGNEKLLRLQTRELYAFIINNEIKLKCDFVEAMASELLTQNVYNPVAIHKFRFPREYVFTFDERENPVPCNKNVYDGYLLYGKPRSSGEIRFEGWCNETKEVDWFYRNGDKGETFFSITYEDNAGKQKLFYPDYIVGISGEVWIVEVKGGWNSSNGSENIDDFAAKKATALQRYCQGKRVKGAFVCYQATQNRLLASNTGYSEDVSNKCWRIINELICDKK